MYLGGKQLELFQLRTVVLFQGLQAPLPAAWASAAGMSHLRRGSVPVAVEPV